MYVCIDVGNATDGQSRQDDFGSGIDAQVQLVIDDLPLGIHNGLILIRIRDAHLCILLFRPTERLNQTSSALYVCMYVHGHTLHTNILYAKHNPTQHLSEQTRLVLQ